MSGFGVLVVIVFVIVAVLDSMKKAGRGTGTPTRRPLPRAPIPPGSGGPASGGPARAGGNSEVMIPDELWAVITGERRTPAARPAAEPRSSAGAPSAAEERSAGASRFEVPAREEPPDGGERPAVWPPAPPPEPAPVAVVAAAAPTPETGGSAPRRPRAESALLADLAAGRAVPGTASGGRAHALRRAIVLATVFGAPKALE